ncbi:site-specific DNA-methyltransferase [Cronbergia sp. UHCC 0137]|uniref:DNA-methyltransferase n=1 Tax=Cronbergia sp. UHCC 0137 TaxID=3110239 RepID=UPI002B220890|nr:site-specific DNA-methyltransferase [Cronbergia sp. UHCC 0137]MEA5620869.1 site-specific DNA-methyltransferase [Cronbergia sp. UHCC 0137]
MLEIEPSSVALSVWSPPYFVGKQYEKGETFESWQTILKKVIENHALVLKPGGFLVINIADILCFKDENIPRIQALNISHQKCKVTREMVLETRQKYPHYTRYQLAELLGCSEQTIDRRLNGNNIRGGKYLTQTRVKLVSHYLEKYAYNIGIYLYDKRIWAKDPCWANSQWTTNSLKAVSEYEDLYIFWKPGEYVIDRSKLSNQEWKEWGSRGIWFINSVRVNNDHEAKFPEELATRIIRLFSAKGDLVIDPFMGSGTTAIAAIKTDRKYIGIEKELSYVTLAEKRIQETTFVQTTLNFASFT